MRVFSRLRRAVVEGFFLVEPKFIHFIFWFVSGLGIIMSPLGSQSTIPGTQATMENSVPQANDGIRSIYLAGRIAALDWRHTLVQGLRDDFWSWKDCSSFPVLEGAIYGRYDYVGPFWPFVASAPKHHHIPGMYLMAYLHDKLDDEKYMNYCRHAITGADLVAGYFDDPSADWLTASQLVYTLSLGKKVLSINPCPFEDLFVQQLFTGDPLHWQSPPRVSLGRQLGLTDAEINRDSGMGFVYFIESVANSHIKIGWANDPNQRIRDFQTGSPTEYVILGTIPGSRTLEHKLHLEFEEFRIQGEWFFGVRRLRKFIESNVLPFS